MSGTYVEWRAYVGPPYLPDTDGAFWDWATNITYGGTNDPLTDQAATTLSSNMTSGSTTVPCTDSTGLPSTGGVWVGPSDWEYILYETNSANTLGTLTRDAVTAEQDGSHTAGDTVKFWWELDTAGGDLHISESMTNNMSAQSVTLELEGIAAPQAALRIGHSVLVQIRTAPLDTGVFGSWTNEFYGWIETRRVRDDAAKVRTWDITVVSVDGVGGLSHVDTISVGSGSDKPLSATASTTLAKAYKAHGEGEFTSAEPSLAAGQAIDGEAETLWISERFVGNANTPTNPGTSYDGIQEVGLRTPIISQVHTNPYPGQGNGYRWIELTMLKTVANLQDILVYSKSTTDNSLTGDAYSIDYWMDMEDGNGGELNQAYTIGDKVIFAEDPTLFAAENTSNDATLIADAYNYDFKIGIAATYKFSATGGTSGTFTISGAAGSANYNTNWVDLANYIATGDSDLVVGGWGGPLDVAPIFITVGVSSANRGYGDYTMPAETDSIAGATLTVQKVIAGNDSEFGAPGTVKVFDVIDNTGGSWTVRQGTLASFENVMSTFRYGDNTQGPAIGDVTQHPGTSLWGLNGNVSNDNVAPNGLGSGDTARYIYGPSAPSEPKDYWEVGRIHTPGYEPVTIDYTGTHTGGTGSTWLDDSAASWTVNQLVEYLVFNTSDNSYGRITYNSNTSIVAPLSGGTNNTWTYLDNYFVMEIGAVAYENTPEWLAVELGGIELELQADIDDTTTTISVGTNVEPTGDGLDSSGTIQIGTEQISYTSINYSTGALGGTVTRGANGTAAAAHSEGDPIYVVSGGIASRANLIESVTFYRKTGQPLPNDIAIFYSQYEDPRLPSSYATTSRFEQDWDFGTATLSASWTTGTEYDTYTWTPSSSVRAKWVLIFVAAMDSTPERVMINEVTAVYDSSVSETGDTLTGATAAEAIEQLLLNAGIPDAAITVDANVSVDLTGTHDGGDNQATLTDSGESFLVDGFINLVVQNSTDGSSATVTDNDATTMTGTLAGGTDNDWDDGDTWKILSLPADNYMTEDGSVWRIVADMAEFTLTRINVDRCSAIAIDGDPFWYIDGDPTATGTLNRSDIMYFEPNHISGRNVGQVELNWRNLDNTADDYESFPATKDTLGDVVRVGPYIYPNSTLAQSGAQKRYYQMRRPYDVMVEVTDIGRTYRPGEFYTITWQIDDEMSAMARTYEVVNADHSIEDGTWVTVLALLQVTRTDEL